MMRSLLARLRSYLRQLRSAESTYAEMDEEMRFHIDMEAERLQRERGLAPEEARRQAAIAFGGMEAYKEAGQDARGLGWLTGLSLDVRLGLRMLRKYPGLSLVGVTGMAVAIAIGASVFSFIRAATDPALPLEEGERIVAVRNMDAVTGQDALPTHLHDLEVWREELAAVGDFGAYRTVDRNVVTPDGRAEPLRVAEITASGFRVARVPPLLGRYLVEGDEQPGAPPVVVIGHRVWQTRFAGDPSVVGRTLQLGVERHTIVGVMPEGFAFPVNNGIWTPLRLDPLDYERGEAPPIEVFGRLAPGATLEQVQAQLTAIGQRVAAVQPETHEHLRPEVIPYAHALLDNAEALWLFYLIQLVVSMLLVVIAINVAILVYARTATRTGEIAVRLALGASRARVVAQLFTEALVLSLSAAALGLAAAWFALRQVNAYTERVAGEQVPFWWKADLSTGTVLYALGLAALAAVIAGVAPGLKATGRRMQASLRELGGGTGMRMGRTWTVLIIGQVAVAVAVLPATAALAWKEFFPTGVAVREFDSSGLLSASLGMDRETPPSAEAEAYRREFGARLADRHAELERRLEAEPGVAGVTYASGVASGTLEVEDPRPGVEPARHATRFVRVEPELFDVFGADILAGRALRPGDLAGAATAVVVNRSFAEQLLAGRDPVGRRFRYARTDGGVMPGNVQEGDWYEIVGVVEDFPVELPYRWEGVPTLYHPVAPGRLNPATLVVRTRGVAPERFAGRLREITMAVDPTLRLGEVRTVAQRQRDEERTRRQLALAVSAVALSVVLLSAAGIHALMSFTVARRRREIGIRTALGAQPRRILASVFSRAAAQLAAGAALGGLLGGALIVSGGYPAGRAAGLLLFVAALMLGVGLLAALGPARQGLRIQPMEALREE